LAGHLTLAPPSLAIARDAIGNCRSSHPLDLTGNCQSVRVGYLSDQLNSFVIYSAIEYRLGFEPRMGATVRGRSIPRRPWASLLSVIFAVTLAVTLDYFRLFVPKWEIGPLCYNEFQRYCHGLLVTR
jgi:hypothetical protein